MEQLVIDAHMKLSATMQRLSAEYQQATHEAGIRYQQGLHAAQAEFEAALHEATQSAVASFHNALNTTRGTK